MEQLKNSVLKIYNKHKKAILFWSVLAVSLGFLIKGVSKFDDISKGKEMISYYENSIEEEYNRRAEIEDLATKVNTPEYIERVASEKLGLVKSNATIFYDVSDTE